MLLASLSLAPVGAQDPAERDHQIERLRRLGEKRVRSLRQTMLGDPVSEASRLPG